MKHESAQTSSGNAQASAPQPHAALDPSSYTLHETTMPALALMRAHARPYFVSVLGQRFEVLPGVWSPAHDWSGQFHIENLPDVRDKDVLEIGCGCGLISVVASQRGARSITAVDINPRAVENTLRNFQRFGVQGGRAWQSDGFASLQSSFDLIIWNAPFHGAQPGDMLERACADAGYRDTRIFFQALPAHLQQDGKVLFGFSTSGDLDLLHSLITHNGLQIVRRRGDQRQGYNCEVFELTLDASGRPAGKAGCAATGKPARDAAGQGLTAFDGDGES